MFLSVVTRQQQQQRVLSVCTKNQYTHTTMTTRFSDLIQSKPKPKSITEVIKTVKRNSYMKNVDSRLRLLASSAKTAVVIDSLLDSSVLVALRIRPLNRKEKAW